MSIYVPKRLTIVQTDRGYELHDDYGLFDGPYATWNDAAAARRANLDKAE